MTEEEVKHDQAEEKYQYSFDFIQKKLEGKKDSYGMLMKEIVRSGICTECGTCAAVCPVLEWDHLTGQPKLIGKCTGCGICYNQCPRTITDPIQLPPGRHDLNIQFVGVNLNNPDAVVYRYKMEGLGNTWSEEFAENQVTFNKLPDGKYVFNLSATNSEGIYDEDPVLLHITIAKPIWKRWWFYGLLLVVVSAGRGLVAAALGAPGKGHIGLIGRDAVDLPGSGPRRDTGVVDGSRGSAPDKGLVPGAAVGRVFYQQFAILRGLWVVEIVLDRHRAAAVR